MRFADGILGSDGIVVAVNATEEDLLRVKCVKILTYIHVCVHILPEEFGLFLFIFVAEIAYR